MPKKIKIGNQEYTFTDDATPEDIQAVVNRLQVQPSPRPAPSPLPISPAGVQARASRHNQSLSPEERASQYNQDWDHYMVGNEMAGPQFPLWQRLGAVAPAVGHELLRPVIASSPAVTESLNKIFGTKDQPVWISEGAGAGGAAAEPSPGISGMLRNLNMLYRGATNGPSPDVSDKELEAKAEAAARARRGLGPRQPAPSMEDLLLRLLGRS